MAGGNSYLRKIWEEVNRLKEIAALYLGRTEELLVKTRVVARTMEQKIGTTLQWNVTPDKPGSNPKTR